MTALEIAECFELYACDHKPDGWPAIRQDTLNNAASLLRRQHEAILKLRVALEMIDDTLMGGSMVEMLCRNALKDTEDLK